MRNMGIAPFNIASSVILITAQRLARRLCTVCREAPTTCRAKPCWTPASSEATSTAAGSPIAPVGCSACNGGYKGRVGIYQVMPITEEIQKIILRDGSALDIAQAVRSRRRAFPAPVGTAESHAGTDIA